MIQVLLEATMELQKKKKTRASSSLKYAAACWCWRGQNWHRERESGAEAWDDCNEGAFSAVRSRCELKSSSNYPVHSTYSSSSSLAALSWREGWWSWQNLHGILHALLMSVPPWFRDTNPPASCAPHSLIPFPLSGSCRVVTVVAGRDVGTSASRCKNVCGR